MHSTQLFDMITKSMTASSVLIIVAGLVAHLFFSRSAAWRYQIWLWVMISILSLPGLILVTQDLNWRWSPINAVTDAMVMRTHWMPIHQKNQISPEKTLVTTHTSALPRDEISRNTRLTIGTRMIDPPNDLTSNTIAPFLQTALFWIWISGSAFLILRWMAGRRRIVKILRGSEPVTDEAELSALNQVCQELNIKEAPSLRSSQAISTPMVYGFWSPVILLPDIEPPLRLSEVEQVFLHECAHLQRRDHWVWLLQRLARLVYWINPCFHWLHREINRAREELCDNRVLQKWNPIDYATTLSKISRLRPSPMLPINGLSLGRQKHQLVQRVESILDQSLDHRTKLQPFGRLASGWICILFTLAGATIGDEFSQAAQEDPSTQETDRRSSSSIPSTEISYSRSTYPDDQPPQSLKTIAHEKVEFYPWLDDADHHRIPKSVIKDYPIQYYEGSYRGKDGIMVSKQCAWLLGIDGPTLQRINQLLADAYHEFRQYEGAHMQAIEDDGPYTITREGYNKVLEAYSFKLTAPTEQIKTQVRTRLKLGIQSLLDEERADIIWTHVGQIQPDHLAHLYTYQLDDLGTELNIRRYPFYRGQPSGQSYPEEWDRYAPRKMAPILRSWRNRVKESLNDTDERKIHFRDNHTENDSILEDVNPIHWHVNQPFVDVPKKAMATLAAPGLNIFGETSAPMIAALGLNEEECHFLNTQFRLFESQFRHLETAHFHPIDDPEFNYQLDAFPEEAEALKTKWTKTLVDKFKHPRAALIDKCIRLEMSLTASIKAQLEISRRDPELLNQIQVRQEPVWLNEGMHPIKLHFSIHEDEKGNKRCKLRIKSRRTNGGSSNSSLESLQQPFRHLLAPLFTAPDPL